MRSGGHTGALAFLIAALSPASAAAYAGPGAGISLTIGLIVALGMAIGFVVIWPLRSLFRRRGQPSAGPQAESHPKSGSR